MSKEVKRTSIPPIIPGAVGWDIEYEDGTHSYVQVPAGPDDAVFLLKSTGPLPALFEAVQKHKEFRGEPL